MILHELRGRFKTLQALHILIIVKGLYLAFKILKILRASETLKGPLNC